MAGSASEIRRRFGINTPPPLPVRLASKTPPTPVHLTNPDNSQHVHIQSDNKTIQKAAITAFEQRGFQSTDQPPPLPEEDAFDEACAIDDAKRNNLAHLHIQSSGIGPGAQAARALSQTVGNSVCNVIKPENLHVGIFIGVIACIGVFAICKLCGSRCTGCCNSKKPNAKNTNTEMKRDDNSVTVSIPNDSSNPGKPNPDLKRPLLQM